MAESEAPWKAYQGAPANKPWEAYAPEAPPQREVNKPLQFFQKFAQGATFGFGDEISAGMVGALASITGGDFDDAYQYALGNIRADEEAYSQQNPRTAMGMEMLGAIATGGAAGARMLPSATMRAMSPAGRVARTAAVGGAEGAAYGAGTATEGERGGEALKGLLIGSVAAPVGMKVMDMAVQGLGTTVSYAARKLGQTPRDQAERALRAAAEAEGIDAEDAVNLLNELGPQATLADLGENFRSLARAASNMAGPLKTEGRNMVNGRQAGQQSRLLEAAQVASGQQAGNFNVARHALVEGRKANAAPLYQSAFLQDIPNTDGLQRILNRPDMKSSMARAARMAANEGDDVGDNLLKRIHYGKMDLDDKIGAAVRAGQANKVRILTEMKGDLLREVDSLSPDYQQARQIYSTDSRMLNAMDEGLNLFKYSAEDMDDAIAGMSASEMDLFRLGAVRSIKEHLDTTGMNRDATQKLLNTQSMRDKLGRIFPNPDDFIRRASAENEFSRTRNVLTGNSTTAAQLEGGAALRDSIQPELIGGLVTGDPVATGRALLSIFTKKEVTPESVNELAQSLLQQGIAPDEVRRIFAVPTFKRAIGSAYQDVVVPALGGSVGAATSAAVE
jgi:hypothetical protein